MREEDQEREIGLYDKYIVLRHDGSTQPGGKHERCRFFVLDLAHDKFAVPALRAYADACEAEYPELARDLRDEANANDPVALAAYDAAQDAAVLRIFGPSPAGTSAAPFALDDTQFNEYLKKVNDPDADD